MVVWVAALSSDSSAEEAGTSQGDQWRPRSELMEVTHQLGHLLTSQSTEFGFSTHSGQLQVSETPTPGDWMLLASVDMWIHVVYL